MLNILSLLFVMNVAEDMRRIILKGSKEQIEAARTLLLEKVLYRPEYPLVASYDICCGGGDY